MRIERKAHFCVHDGEQSVSGEPSMSCSQLHSTMKEGSMVGRPKDERRRKGVEDSSIVPAQKHEFRRQRAHLHQRRIGRIVVE
jgi:hypothetical protein